MLRRHERGFPVGELDAHAPTRVADDNPVARAAPSHGPHARALWPADFERVHGSPDFRECPGLAL